MLRKPQVASRVFAPGMSMCWKPPQETVVPSIHSGIAAAAAVAGISVLAAGPAAARGSVGVFIGARPSTTSRRRAGPTRRHVPIATGPIRDRCGQRYDILARCGALQRQFAPSVIGRLPAGSGASGPPTCVWRRMRTSAARCGAGRTRTPTSAAIGSSSRCASARAATNASSSCGSAQDTTPWRTSPCIGPAGAPVGGGQTAAEILAVPALVL